MILKTIVKYEYELYVHYELLIINYELHAVHAIILQSVKIELCIKHVDLLEYLIFTKLIKLYQNKRSL